MQRICSFLIVFQEQFDVFLLPFMLSIIGFMISFVIDSGYFSLHTKILAGLSIFMIIFLFIATFVLMIVWTLIGLGYLSNCFA